MFKIKSGLYYKTVRYFIRFKSDEEIGNIEIYPWAGEKTRLIYISKDSENNGVKGIHYYNKNEWGTIIDVKKTLFNKREYICGFGTDNNTNDAYYTEGIDVIYSVAFYRETKNINMDNVAKELCVDDYKKFYMDMKNELINYDEGRELI